jgi:hypothetical protein
MYSKLTDFEISLMTYIVDYKHPNCDKHTNLLQNPYITSPWDFIVQVPVLYVIKLFMGLIFVSKVYQLSMSIKTSWVSSST